MTVSEALCEHFVRGLRIRANGAFFPYWIESVGGSSRCWKLAAILPGSARHADATVTLEISTIDALSTTSGQFRRSVAVSAIELIIVPSSPQSAFCFDAESPWLLSGWEPATPAGARLRDDASTVLLPTLASAPNATVSAFGDDLDLIASVALNGAKLQRRENATPLVFEILREQWAQHVNLLTFYLSLDPVAAAAERRPAIRSVEIAES